MAITVTRKALVNMANVKETVLSVTGKKQAFVDTYQTLNVNSVAASYVLIVGGPQKKGFSPDVVQQKALKYVKDVSCVSDLSFVPNITNVPVVAPDLPIGARLHHFWEIWAALGASPKVITVFREGYTPSLQIRPNFKGQPTS